MRIDRTAPGETPNAGKARRHDNLPPEVTSTPRITIAIRFDYKIFGPSERCRRHSSIELATLSAFLFFFSPRERSNTILRYTADISKYIAGWDRSGRVPLEGEKSRARCKSYLSLDTHTCWLCSLEISSCLITVVTGDNPISCSIARKVENYTYNS